MNVIIRCGQYSKLKSLQETKIIYLKNSEKVTEILDDFLPFTNNFKSKKYIIQLCYVHNIESFIQI